MCLPTQRAWFPKIVLLELDRQALPLRPTTSPSTVRSTELILILGVQIICAASVPASAVKGLNRHEPVDQQGKGGLVCRGMIGAVGLHEHL